MGTRITALLPAVGMQAIWAHRLDGDDIELDRAELTMWQALESWHVDPDEGKAEVVGAFLENGRLVSPGTWQDEGFIGYFPSGVSDEEPLRIARLRFRHDDREAERALAGGKR